MPIVKRIHTVDGVTFVRFDESIVKELALDESEVWVEQRVINNDIVMVIRRDGKAAARPSVRGGPCDSEERKW